jgi:hypothetical protein
VESVGHQPVVNDSREGYVATIPDACVQKTNPIVVGYVHPRVGSEPVSLPGVVERGRPPDYLMSLGDQPTGQLPRPMKPVSGAICRQGLTDGDQPDAQVFSLPELARAGCVTPASNPLIPVSKRSGGSPSHDVAPTSDITSLDGRQLRGVVENPARFGAAVEKQVDSGQIGDEWFALLRVDRVSQTRETVVKAEAPEFSDVDVGLCAPS